MRFRHWVTLLGAAGALLLSLSPSRSGPLGPFDLQEILARSDLAAVVTPVGGQRCRVEAVYHGAQFAAGDVIELSYPKEPRGPGDHFNHDLRRAIADDKAPLCLFLKRAAPGGQVLTFAHAETYSGFRVAPTRPKGPLTGKEAIEAEVMQGLQAKNPQVIDDAVIWADYLKSERIFTELKRLAGKKDSPEPIQVWMLKEGILQGKHAAVEGGIAFMKQHPAEGAPAQQGGPQGYTRVQGWHNTIARALTRINTVDDSAAFNRIFRQADRNIAFLLVHSAVNWADKSSIHRLMEALSRDDRYAQYACLRALGKLTGRPIPTESAFNQDRHTVIKAWQAWWEGQAK